MRKPNLLTGTLALTALSFFSFLAPYSRPCIAQNITSEVLPPDISFAPLELKSLQASGDAIRGNPDVAEVRPVFYLAQNDAGDSPGNRSTYEGERQENSRTADTGVDGPNDRLIDRVVDPFSWLMQFRFREDWNWPVGDSGPDSQQFEFRPTIPFKAWDQTNLLRITVPYDIQGSNAPGLDKVSIFNALIFEPDWGRWGIGPEVQFDPHSTSGQDEFQIGPVFGAVTKSKHWTVGFICQNFLSFNDSETQIQPILAYKFNDKLALAIGDMQFKYDWNKGQWTQLPLGVELDYIADFWGQKIQWFVNPQYNFETTSSNSGWTVYVGLTLLVPGA